MPTLYSWLKFSKLILSWSICVEVSAVNDPASHAESSQTASNFGGNTVCVSEEKNEKLLEDISYNASDMGPQKIHINKQYV